MYRKTLMIVVLALAASTAGGQNIPAVPDDFYDQALDYMIQHPPQVMGADDEARADNDRLAEENRRLYEGMSRLELVMNYLALKCAEAHPARDAVCDGRAIRLLREMEYGKPVFRGS